MERLSGRTLVDELAGGPLDEPRLREIAEGVLGALAAAHAEGIVHRDVKPANILLDDEHVVKIGDFGIATTLDATETTTGIPLGTPAYTAPERLRGLAASECSDLYSLGVVLYEAAAGERPFRGDGSVAIAEAVVAGAHRPLGDRRPDLSPDFVAAVERAMATDPAERFESADAMLAVLASAAVAPKTVPLQPPSAPTATLPVPARVGTPPAPRGEARRERRREPRRDRRWRGIVAAAVSVVLATALVFLITRSDDASPPTTAPSSTAPAVTAVTTPVASGAALPVPEPLARALDRLERATRP
jgi:serine/threonine-protein kinase